MSYNRMDAPNHKSTGTLKGTGKQPNYLSYLLRLYRVSDEGDPVWRMSLESALTGGRDGFANLDDLLAFLRQQMGIMPDADRDEP